MSWTYRLVWNATMTVAAVCTFVALLFSYLTVVSAGGSKCAGQAMVAGYRSGAVDIFGFPLFCAIGFGVFFLSCWRIQKDARIAKLIEADDTLVVFEFLSVRIGYGMFGFLAFFLVFVSCLR